MTGKNHLLRCALGAAVVLKFLLLVPASAGVFNMPPGQTSLQFTQVGNASNPSDPLTGFGGVDYDFRMGRNMVTIGQYTQFLNAVAATDTYGLYNASMATNANIAGIARSGDPGSYTYSPIGSPNRPIAFVNWGDAARFSNWLTNGQPTGPQGPGTTETGSYALNGATSQAALMTVTRIADQDRVQGQKYYFVPTENEWYKAAYYDPTRGGSDYWLYPMRTDAVPYSAPPPGTSAPDAAFTGNFFRFDGVANGYDDGYAVTGSTSSPPGNALTDVGAYTSALSYYGTFDQGGNLFEWNEAVIGSGRGIRGGSWNSSESNLRATTRLDTMPTNELFSLGFRVSEVPEPATAALLALGGVLMLRRRKRLT